MKKQLIIVRGYPGSGKTSLAEQLAADGGSLFVQDEMVAPEYKGQSPFGMPLADALGATVQAVLDEMQAGQEKIIVDTVASRLWMLRPFVELADQAGFEVTVKEPTTEWAHDRQQCQERTHLELSDDVWSWLVKDWEETPTVEEIRNALTPTERLQIARWLAATADASGEKFERERFLYANYLKESEELARDGFLNHEKSPAIQQAFINRMTAEGVAPPTLSERRLIASKVATLDQLIAEMREPKRDLPSAPDLN